MAAQNIIELGFDIPKFDSSTQHVINGLIKAYEAAEKLNNLKIDIGSKGGFSELISKTKQLETVTEEYAKALKDVEKASKDKMAAELAALKVEQQKLKVDQEVLKTMQQEERAAQQEIKTKKDRITYEAALAREKAKGLSQAQAEAKIADQLTDEYALLNKALKDAELRYKNLALTIGFQAEQTELAKNEALEIRAVLDKVDTNLRNHQRNVGNYASAFNGLGNSVGQVARELPALAINFQTFALAISNNLPILFDEVGNARREIAALRAEGKETPSLISRIGKSFLSWNVVLSVAIALFTVFSKQIMEGVKALFGLDNAQLKAAESADRMLAVTMKLVQAQKELNALEYGARNGLEKSEQLENELRILQSLNKSKGDQLALEVKLADIKAAEASTLFVTTGGFQTLADKQLALVGAEIQYNTLLRDQAQITTEEGRKALDAEIERSARRLENAKYEAGEAKRIVEDQIRLRKDAEVKLNELQVYQAEEARKIASEEAKYKASVTIDANERILNDERKFEQERIAALSASASARKRIVAADLALAEGDPSNNGATGPTSTLVTARKAAALEDIKIEKDKNEAIFQVREEFRKRRLAAELAINKAQVEFDAARLEETAQSEANSFGERMEAYGAFVAAEQALLAKQYEYDKATAVRTKEELLQLETEYARKLKELSVKSRKEISDIIVSSNMDELTEVRSIENLKLSEEQLALYKRLKNKQKFIKESEKLEREGRRQELNDNIYIDKEIINSTQTTEEAKKAASRRVRDNQAKLNLLDLEELKTTEAKKLAEKELYYQIELKALETFFSIASILSNANHQERLDQIREEREALDENYAREVENIRNSTISEQEKAARLTTLQIQQAAKKQELLNKENAEKTRQAKLDKAITIGKIISETALAVIHQLTTGDPVSAFGRALLAGATGAAQLAIAIATPIPSYREGTDNHPGGLAKVHPGEVIDEPGRAPRFTPNAPETLMHLAPGTRVITAEQVMASAGGAMVANQQERAAIAARVTDDVLMKELISTVRATGRNTEKAMRRQKAPVVNFVSSGDHANWVEKNVRG